MPFAKKTLLFTRRGWRGGSLGLPSFPLFHPCLPQRNQMGQERWTGRSEGGGGSRCGCAGGDGAGVGGDGEAGIAITMLKKPC